MNGRRSKIIRKKVAAEILAMPKRNRPDFKETYMKAKAAWKRTLTASWPVIMTRRERKEAKASVR